MTPAAPCSAGIDCAPESWRYGHFGAGSAFWLHASTRQSQPVDHRLDRRQLHPAFHLKIEPAVAPPIPATIGVERQQLAGLCGDGLRIQHDDAVAVGPRGVAHRESGETESDTNSRHVGLIRCVLQHRAEVLSALAKHCGLHLLTPSVAPVGTSSTASKG